MGAALRNGTHRTAFSLRFPVRRKKYLKPYLPNELKLAPMLPNAPYPHIDGRYGLQAGSALLGKCRFSTTLLNETADDFGIR